jgi:CheY-like chemotaxis protein
LFQPEQEIEKMAKILLIEDMKGVQTSISLILKNAGHEVSIADNGREGVNAFQRGSFDLVITDILMPEMDGTEVLFSLKKHSRPPRMIAISAGGGSIAADEALAVARSVADMVLEKPFSRGDLLDSINRVLSSN